MNVEFEEDKYAHMGSSMENAKTGSKIGDWMVRSGLAKDASSASMIMVIGALLIFGLSIYLFVYGFHLPTFGPAPSTDIPFPVPMT